MIVAATQRRGDLGNHPQRPPIQPDLGQSGAHQRTDKHDVTAVFGAQQPRQATDLTERDPVMPIGSHALGIAKAPDRENRRLPPALEQRVRNSERQASRACNDPDRRLRLRAHSAPGCARPSDVP